MENNEKEFFTLMEFADKIRVHPNTVRKAIKDGRIQAFRVGLGARSSFRIPVSEVNRICEMDMMTLINRLIDDRLEKKE